MDSDAQSVSCHSKYGTTLFVKPVAHIWEAAIEQPLAPSDLLLPLDDPKETARSGEGNTRRSRVPGSSRGAMMATLVEDFAVKSQ
jgi:hypothetical protein